MGIEVREASEEVTCKHAWESVLDVVKGTEITDAKVFQEYRNRVFLKLQKLSEANNLLIGGKLRLKRQPQD